MLFRQTIPKFFQSNRGSMFSTRPQQRDHFAEYDDARFGTLGGVFRFGDGPAEKLRKFILVGHLVYQDTGQRLLRIECRIAARRCEGSNVQTTRR